MPGYRTIDIAGAAPSMAPAKLPIAMSKAPAGTMYENTKRGVAAPRETVYENEAPKGTAPAGTVYENECVAIEANLLTTKPKTKVKACPFKTLAPPPSVAIVEKAAETRAPAEPASPVRVNRGRSPKRSYKRQKSPSPVRNNRSRSPSPRRSFKRRYVKPTSPVRDKRDRSPRRYFKRGNPRSSPYRCQGGRDRDERQHSRGKGRGQIRGRERNRRLSEDYNRRKAYRKVKPDKKKGFCARHRCLCCCLIWLIILGALIIAGLLGGIAYLNSLPTNDQSPSSTPAPSYSGRVHTFFESVCDQHRNVCAVGSPPSQDSCKVGTCIYYEYNITSRRQILDQTKQVNLTVDSERRNRYRLLCRMPDDRMGVCDGDECKLRYNGEDNGSDWNVEGKWVDNCDEPNPCWNDRDGIEAMNNRTGVHITREKCNQKNLKCPPDVDAVLWMQHLRCKHGKNWSASKPCQGLPFKLWKCRDCVGRNESCVIPMNGTCIKVCNNRRHETIQDGVRCKQGDWYCFGGVCMEADANTKKILNKQKCIEEKRSHVI